MDRATLESRLAAFPRVPLARYPTRLEPLPRLTAALGHGAPAIWCKRDDAIGPAMGGNKARNLEFLLADARRRHASKVVTFGGLQSNHARITAAAARQLEMEPHVFYFARRPCGLQGNLLLSSLADARLHFVPLGGGDGSMTLEMTNRLVRLLSSCVVGPSYFVPVGGHAPLGCLGYVLAALEIDTQVQALGLKNVTVVTAAGTGGTLAGLLAGFALLESPVRVLGLEIGKLWKDFRVSIARLYRDTCGLLGAARLIAPENIPLILDRYAGPAYGVPSVSGNTAIRRLAECEGIFLDPIYTGKAMAGLLDLVEQRYWSSSDTVVFLHTGGVPGLFAFPEVCSRS